MMPALRSLNWILSGPKEIPMFARFSLWTILSLGLAFAVACQESTGPEETASHGSLAAANGPVQNPANGHWYEFVESSGISWTDAKIAAEAMDFMGSSGHLATIHSQQENDFVADLVDLRAWLGGFQPEGSPEPDGGWQWVTGEPFDYTNWNSGEPNEFFGRGDEDYIEMLGPPHGAPGKWNDALNTSTPGLPSPGFVVEYELVNPTSKDQCKKDGWRAFGFKNQGQCIRFVNTGKDSRIGADVEFAP
jgi:hypothetical protein